jgi:hypothetical protein
MGLDMYAFSVIDEVQVLPPVDAQLDASRVELAYWRKHPNLHGWMEKLYREKGGTSQDFNTDTVELTAADLDKLEADIHERRLPSTSGFFFGASDGSEFKDDLAFIKRARIAIAEGQRVYYDSWW